jgi:hypothetical protein
LIIRMSAIFGSPTERSLFRTFPVFTMGKQKKKKSDLFVGDMNFTDIG